MCCYSRDYEKLYDLVVNKKLIVPCFIDYKFRDSDHVFRDIAAVSLADYKKELSISIGVRGTTYSTANEFQVKLSKSFKTVKDMFIRDCTINNVEFVDMEYNQ